MMWRRRLRVWMAVACGLAVAALAPHAYGQNVTLRSSLAGNLDFTGTTATMRTSGGTGSSTCAVRRSTDTLSKTLTGLPQGATVVAAYLYWAGSGYVDSQVTFQGKTINAERTYSGTFPGNGNAYFSGVANVTSLVKGNGTYTFSGLTINTSSAYCSVEGVLGGFALLVIYSHPDVPFRVLNLYEGFRYTHSPEQPSFTLNLTNFTVPTPLNNNTARIGHITWEGDDTLSGPGENLMFNNTVLQDPTPVPPTGEPINPPNNQFNSKSNINGDPASWGIDFDAYTIGAPIIQAGDTKATTVYSSVQDLVWLSAEIVAVPNIPVADLALTMVRTGDPSPGAIVNYTLTVTNNGPYEDAGPITVVDKLPPGMVLQYASGTNWTCSASGNTITCQYSGTVANGQTLPQLTVSAQVDTSGTTSFHNEASVATSASRFDNTPANNTAFDDSTDSTLIGAEYVFTTKACPDGARIGDPTTCPRFVGPLLAATPQTLYVTLQSGGYAASQSNSSNKSLRFALGCVNPGSANGKVATLTTSTTLTLNSCYSGTVNTYAQWTSYFSAAFSKTPSAYIGQFKYPDVGIIQLDVQESNGRNGSARFVSYPQVSYVSITNSNDNGANPGGTLPFSMAGEPFNVGIKVADADGNFPPNFGREAGPYGPVTVALGAPDPSKLGKTFTGPVNGVYTGRVTWADLGSVNLAATIAGQPGQGWGEGTYFGHFVPGVTSSIQKVGYFYPAYFTTDASGPMTCLPRMKCPTGKLAGGELAAIDTAAYSGQPFEVDVHAFNSLDTDVTTQMSSIPAFTITLDPFSAPGPTGSTAGTLAANTLPSSATPLSTLTPSLKLGVPYVTGQARAAWTAPTPTYVRATAKFNRVAAAPPSYVEKTVTSNRGAGGLSKEGGVQVVAGRLLVANSNGSELLKLPLHVYGQYWAGTSWDNNPNDNTSKVNNIASFGNCQKKLPGGGTASSTCNAFVLQSLSSGTWLQLAEGGQATFWLKAAGAGNAGSASVTMDATLAPWLPSTTGTVVFGVYRSRLIYIREVY
ncbi:hypothetical protein NX773_15900 [Massilia solisilvae]|uniref:DUF11 domain-containing protein n=1 Tax=Massilia solisilvae TaxID=1811225 RepID=A0ABT2BMF7_9BURK|nr:DUF6701 domain-containing protein [Massilia solisilvae]MCS0609650.1 hypothetical protein [Massilia solisilvae]